MSDRERLRVPLGASFEDRLPESRAHRLWQRVEAARARRRVVPVSLAGGLAVAAALLSVLAFWWLRPSSPAALRLAEGGDVPPSMTAPTRRSVAFDDGSKVDLAPGARLDVLESNGRAFGLALREGSSEFEVRPGGPRTWHVEVSGVTVEVVGTHFTVERARDSLRVGVTRGAVVVRGDRVPDRVVRLGVGQSITVPLVDESGAPAPAPVLPEAVPAGSASFAEPPGAVPPGTDPASHMNPRPEEARARATQPSVSRSASPSGSESPPSTTLDTLLGAADAARREARFGEAARLMEQAVAEHPSEPRAALAEFSLGRLYLDSLGDASRAAAHFSRAIADGRLPGTLAEDAQARLVEAAARAGDSTGASAAAARYRALYPAGRRAADVDRWAPPAR